MGGFGGGIFSGPSLLAMQQQQNSLANAQQDALGIYTFRRTIFRR
jgi:hypothetical protein